VILVSLATCWIAGEGTGNRGREEGEREAGGRKERERREGGRRERGGREEGEREAGGRKERERREGGRKKAGREEGGRKEGGREEGGRREGGREVGKGGRWFTSQETVDQQLMSISVTMATNAVKSTDKSQTQTRTFIRWPMALAYAFLTAALRSDKPDSRVFRSLPVYSTCMRGC